MLVHVHTSWAFVAAAVGYAAVAGVGAPPGLASDLIESAVGALALAVLLTAMAAGLGRTDTVVGFGLVVLYFLAASLPTSIQPGMADPSRLGQVVTGLMLLVGAWHAHRTTLRLAPPAA